MRNTKCHWESILKSPGLLWGHYIHSDLCQCYYFCLNPLLAFSGRTVSPHLALICKAPAISTFGIATWTPCAEKAMNVKGRLGWFSLKLFGRNVVRSLTADFLWLISLRKVCTNTHPCYWASGLVWAVICFSCGWHGHIFHWNLIAMNSGSGHCHFLWLGKEARVILVCYASRSCFRKLIPIKWTLGCSTLTLG